MLSFADGVIKVDPANLNGKKGIWTTFFHLLSMIKVNQHLCNPKTTLNISLFITVFVYLACAFRYGSEDLDVIGLSFRRDIWIQRVQLYPATGGSPTLSPMQECLMKKVGEQGYPFSFQVKNHNTISHYF